MRFWKFKNWAVKYNTAQFLIRELRSNLEKKRLAQPNVLIESDNSCSKEIICYLHRKIIIATNVENLFDFYNHLIKIELEWNCTVSVLYVIERSPLLRNVSKYMYL